MHQVRAALCLLLLGCGTTAAEQQEGALIDGEPVDGAALPATMQLPGSDCTAARIGPRHVLTAAHCVFDSGSRRIMPSYRAGAQLQLRHGDQVVELTVEAAHVSPSWVEACSKAYCTIAHIAAQQDAADVALVVSEEPITLGEPSSIDPRPVQDGELLTVGGYGCGDGVYLSQRYDGLTVAEGLVVPASDALHEGSPIGEADLEAAAGSYFMTAGPWHEGGPGLCPGDSGGPVYRDGRIVGVNANYSLPPLEEDPAGTPVTNWHTRLDDGRHGVLSWLTELGARVDTDE